MMKVKLTLLICAFFALSLSAQRSYSPSPAQGNLVWPQSGMLMKSAMVVDTLVSFDPTCTLGPFLYGVTGGGFVTGTNPYGDLEKAELFSATGTGTISEILVFFGAKKIVGTPDNISVKIYSGNATSGPSTLLGTSNPVSMTNVDTVGIAPTSFTFSTPVSFTNEFFASVEVSTGDDTVGIYHTDVGCQSTAWELWSGNNWNNLASSWAAGGVPLDVGLIMGAVVDITPLSCPQPTALGATNVTTTSADIFWTTGGASDWNVEYGPLNFTPGTGTMVNATNDTLPLSGLSPGTPYSFYVRDSCAQGDVSAWSGPYVFVTQCSVSSLPYTETFEPLSSTTLFCISVQPDWTLAQYGGFGNSTFSLTFPFYDVVSGTYSVVLPEFTPTPANYELSFDFAKAAYDLEADSIEIFYSTDAGATYSLLVGLDGSVTGTLNTAGAIDSAYTPAGAADWSTYSVALPAGVNTIRIDAVSDYGNNIYIDNVSIAPATSAPCAAPTALSASNEGCDSAEVSWTASGSGYSIVEYGPTGYTPGTGTSSYQQSPFVINGLMAGMSYDFYVADTCGADTSAWSAPETFSTLPEPTAAFTSSLGTATLTDLQVSFDATGSMDATSYAWDFGDGNTGTGTTAQNAYTSNGTFTVELVVTGECGTDTITDDVVIQGISIGESALAQSLSVYPNPAADELNISLHSEGEVSVRLLSIGGKQVMARTYGNGNGDFTAALDISKLPQGVYILEVESGNGTAQKRVVKK